MSYATLGDMKIARAGIEWTYAQAQDLCKLLWPLAAKYDWHFGLTGSVIYKGESTKDVDLVFYAHTGTHPTLDGLHAALGEAGMELTMEYPIGYEGKYVEVWHTKEGKRVDIILEVRPG